MIGIIELNGFLCDAKKYLIFSQKCLLLILIVLAMKGNCQQFHNPIKTHFWVTAHQLRNSAKEATNQLCPLHSVGQRDPSLSNWSEAENEIKVNM